jgi:ADP-ribose pyrophosphatase YjhB (NUDIX family)
MASTNEEGTMDGHFIAVGAVVLRGDKVLLGKHTPSRGGPWTGKWICPGGRLHFGEGLEEGVVREVHEETGLRIRLVRYIGTFDRMFPEMHVIYLDFLAEVPDAYAEPRAASDLHEVRWFTKKEISELGDALHDDTRTLLRQAGILN